MLTYLLQNWRKSNQHYLERPLDRCLFFEPQQWGLSLSVPYCISLCLTGDSMLLILMQDSWWMPDASDRDGSNTIMSLCVCVYIYI